MLSPDDFGSPRQLQGSRIILPRGVSPQRTDRNNTVSAGGSGRIVTTDELLQIERRKNASLEERLQALERQMHTSALAISNHAEQMRAMETRAVTAEDLAAGLQSRLMRLAELVKQQKQQGFAAAEFEGLLTQQATNAESRLQTLQEELKLEKENAILLQEEITVAKAAATESRAIVASLDAKFRDADSKFLAAEQRAKASEEKATQQEALFKATEQKLIKLVELVKQDKEREKQKDIERDKERSADREKISALQASLAALQASTPSLGPGSAATVVPTSVNTPAARSSGPSQREMDLVEKLKATDARIQKMTEVMKIADTKVRNAEAVEQRAKTAEEAKVLLESRMKSLEEQLEDAKKVAASALSASQNTDVSSLQTKIVNYEGKIRLLVETVKTERASFQKLLAEAKAPPAAVMMPSQGQQRDGSQGVPGVGVPPPPPGPSSPPPPPPPGPKKGAAKAPAGQSLSNALSGVKLRSAQPNPEVRSGTPPPTDAPKKMPGKVPPIGSPGVNLGSIAEQAAARRAGLKPAPLSPRGPILPPPPPPEP